MRQSHDTWPELWTFPARGQVLAHRFQPAGDPAECLTSRAKQFRQLSLRLLAPRGFLIRKRRQDVREIGLVQQTVQQPFARKRLIIVVRPRGLEERADVVLDLPDSRDGKANKRCLRLTFYLLVGR